MRSELQACAGLPGEWEEGKDRALAHTLSGTPGKPGTRDEIKSLPQQDKHAKGAKSACICLLAFHIRDIFGFTHLIFFFLCNLGPCVYPLLKEINR